MFPEEAGNLETCAAQTALMDPAQQLILAFEWKWHPPTFSKIM